MNSPNRTRVAAAIAAKRRLAERFDKRLLELIQTNPGITVYELSCDLGKNPSTVHAAVRRLVGQGKVISQKVIRKTRPVRRVFPAGFDAPPPDLVQLPRSLIQIDNPAWQQAYIYPLSSDSIGISGEPVPEWEARAPNRIIQPVESEADELRIRLPLNLVEFYNLDKKERQLAYLENKALLTITGVIVP